jgi:hypothetical protein
MQGPVRYEEVFRYTILVLAAEKAFLWLFARLVHLPFFSSTFFYREHMAHVPTIIEQRYQEAVDRLSAREKIAQSFAMFDWARGWIGRQIIEERGAMDTERLRWEVALRVYGDEPGARRLIERHLDRLRNHVPS